MKSVLPLTKSNLFRTACCIIFCCLFFLSAFTNAVSAQSRTVTYTSAGTFSWTAPCGVTSVSVYVWGAGGGGGGANSNYTVGGGGGGGAFTWNNAVTVVPGTTYTITVGAGGEGGDNGNGNNGNGYAGGNSSFSNVIVVGGGQGGQRNPAATFGERGYGITAPGTSWTAVGGNGASGVTGGSGYGGGGGSTGSPNFNGAVNASGATGGIAPAGGGNGGDGQTGNGNGFNGTAPGGGGGGARRTTGNHAGGNGADGRVEIRYTNGPISTYCVPDFTNNVEPITQVRLSNTATAAILLDNVTSATVNGTPDREQFCNIAPVTVSRSTQYTILVRGNTDGNFTNTFRYFIDWNQNGVLDDAGETATIGNITNSNGSPTSTSVSVNFTVPAGATLGYTTLRVMKRYNGDPGNPCSTSYTYGQAEDYVLNVIGNCQYATAASANSTTGTLVVCTNTAVTLRQTGGAISADQNWVWSKSCGGAPENTNTNSDAAYTFTPTGPGITTFYVWPAGGSCGAPSAGNCKSVIVDVRAVGTITVNSGYNANFSACRTVANPTHAVFTVGGGATSASATGLPAGMTGTYAAGTFTISGTPTAAVGPYNYTINLTGNSPCVNPTITGTVTLTDKPTISYAGGPFIYCKDAVITTNTPTVNTGGLTTTFGVQGTPLPAGLTLNTSTGAISGTPTVNTAAANYTIRATNGCGFTDVLINITVINGNTVFDVTPGGSQTICSSSPGINIGLSGSVNSINYQLYRDGSPVGAGVPGTGAAISMGTYNVAGTYTVVATTSCATNMNGSYTLNVTPQPNATFSYAATAFCKSSPNPVPTISGTVAAGAVFSSTAGLVFANTTTGAIDLVNSNVGTYTITYSAGASGGCGAYSYVSPVQITIANSPNTFTVTGGGGYCSGGTGLPVGLNSSQSGVQYQLYRDGNPVGGTINGTGTAISFGNQTVAGIYSITAIMGSCTKNMDGEADIFIKPLPAAIAINPASATICQGTIQPLTATLTPPSTSTGNVTMSSGTINQGIPDNNAGGTAYLFKVTTVPANATITQVSIRYTITHPYDGDLVLNLKGPNGNVLNIANRIGGNGDNFNNTLVNSVSATSITTASAPFGGTYAPHAAGAVAGATGVPANTSNVNTFSGLYDGTSVSANGNWFFSARDMANNDVGTLVSCELVIYYTIVNNSTNVTWSPITDLYSDPAATVPYTSGSQYSTVYVNPSTSGAKVYTATNNGGNGCSTTATTNLTVNASPVISVAANYCSFPGVVRITATSNIAISSWLWNTGVAGTTTSTTSYIDVNAAGTYYVSATASGNSCAGRGSMSIAQELTTNGNFELGNTGFTSDYAYHADNPMVNNELVPDNDNNGYGVGEDGQFYHNYFFGYDHTLGTGTGKYMIVNGHGTNLVVWKNQNVTVLPNTVYYFSAYAISLNDAAPFGQLQFNINNTLVGTSAVLPAGNVTSSAANNGWVKFHGTWNSGTATSADISIVNLQNALGGNDFGIDDVSFGTLTAFFNLSSDPGTNTQTGVCVGSDITDITYEIGGDGNAPSTTGSLPPGVTAYWNGRTYRISGSPTAPGNYTYNVTSSGCGSQTRTVTINVIPASNSGSFAAPIASACYNTAGSIAVTGSVGTSYTWQSSPNGSTSWTNLGAPNSSTYNHPALTNELYYRVIVQNTAGCTSDTSDVVKVGLKNVWTGKTNDNWNTATNWSDEQLPSMSPCANVVIPNTLPSRPLPILSGGSYAINNLQVLTGGGLTILNNATLQIAGSISSPVAAINANDGTIEMNGATQSISGSYFTGRNIERLIVSGGQLNVSNTANDTLNITEKLSFNTTADLNTGDNVTLKSTLSRTASVGVLNAGNAITGRFTVERIVRHYQNWNMLTIPLRENVSVRNSWQEGLNGAPLTSNGFGTRITGPATPAPTGFDNTSVGYSLKWWDLSLVNGSGAGNWSNVINTTTQNVNRPQGFFIFVRGDRGYGPGAAGSITTLRGKGTIYDANNLPSLSITAPINTKVSLANPYASAIGINKLLTANTTNLQPNIWVWDPTLWGIYSVGGYQAITAATGYKATPGNSTGSAIYNSTDVYPNIQSGQAVFVQSKIALSNAAVSFNENMKEDGSMLVNRGGDETANVNPEQVVMLSTHLYAADGRMLDGNRVVFDDMYSDQVDYNDAEKINNTYINFGLKRFNKSLIVEAKTSLKATDTLYYNMSGLPTASFRLGVSVQNINAPQLNAELIDNYLHTRTPVSLTDSSFINFNTTADAASKAADRFMMVFQPSQVVLPVTFVQVAAQRNADRSIDVQWKVANEINIIRYEVERSEDGRNFTGILTRVAANYDTYRQTDLSPLAEDNFYRIKAIGLAGDITYSNTVKVAPEKSPALIVVSPNPVKGKQMNVRFVKQPAGEYVLSLTNNAGQEVYRGAVTVSSGSLVKTIALHPSTAGGTYRLAVFNKKGERVSNEMIMVE